MHYNRVAVWRNRFLATVSSFQEIEAGALEKLEEEIRLLLSDKKRPGAPPVFTFEYIRHGTTSLIGFLDTASGRMESPYLNLTRTEKAFVKAVEALASTDARAFWTFICDGLNTHKSESLVRFVPEVGGIETELGKKEKHSILNPPQQPEALLGLLPVFPVLSLASGGAHPPGCHHDLH